MTAEPVIVLRDVHAAYGPYRALNGCTFEVAAGERVALLGRNTSGDAFVLGATVRRRAPHALVRRGVVHLPEGSGLFYGLSIEENLTLRSGARRGAAGRQRLTAALSMLPEDLRRRRRARAGSLSGGQKRLVAVAAAVAAGPRILIADEPALGLSPVATADVYRSLALAAELDMTLVLIETRLDRVAALCRRVLVLDRGAVAADTTVEDRASIEAALLGTGALSA